MKASQKKCSRYSLDFNVLHPIRSYMSWNQGLCYDESLHCLADNTATLYENHLINPFNPVLLMSVVNSIIMSMSQPIMLITWVIYFVFRNKTMGTGAFSEKFHACKQNPNH